MTSTRSIVSVKDMRGRSERDWKILWRAVTHGSGADGCSFSGAADHMPEAASLGLDRVDGFHQDQAACEADNCREAHCAFLARKATRLKRLSLPTACSTRAPGLVEFGWKKAPTLLSGAPAGNHRGDAADTRGIAIGTAVVTFIGHHQARTDVGSDIQRGFELDAVARLAPGQVEVER